MVSIENRTQLVEQGEILCDDALALVKQGDLSAALARFDEAEAVFHKLQDQQWLNFLWHEKFRLLHQTGRTEEALSLSDEIAAGYKETHNYNGVTLISIHKADLFSELGKPEEAMACLRIAEAIVESKGLSELRGYLFSMLSATLINLKDFVSAIEYLKQALEFYSNESTPSEFSWCLHQMGCCYKEILDFNTAERYLNGSLQSYQKTGDLDACRLVQEDLQKLQQITNQPGKSPKH